MHFWIDKRSQCAYTGRHRVPSSLSSGVGVGRGRVRYGAGAGVGVGIARKGMAAPVHRFTPVDCPPRRPPTRNHARHNGQPPAVGVHSARRQNEEPSLYVAIPPEPQQPTIHTIAAARSVTPDTLLRTAALGLHHGAPMMAPHLKFGMLVSFALATLFLAGAKFYFDKQVVRDNSGGSEATVVCAAVACVCGVGCALSLCRARPPPPLPPDRISSTAQRYTQRDTHADTDLHQPLPSEPSDDISLTTLLQTRSDSVEAPPPYHIAVLLPGREPPPPPRDVSPPAYSALS